MTKPSQLAKGQPSQFDRSTEERAPLILSVRIGWNSSKEEWQLVKEHNEADLQKIGQISVVEMETLDRAEKELRSVRASLVEACRALEALECNAVPDDICARCQTIALIKAQGNWCGEDGGS